MQEQQKRIDELKVLMKILENTQKHTEDRVRGSSFDESKKDKQILDSDSKGEGGKEEFTIDPHAEKMEKLPNQL